MKVHVGDQRHPRQSKSIVEYVADILLSISYVSLIAAAFTRTLRILRILLVVGAVFFIIYGAVQNIPSMIVWNILIGGVHLVRLVRDEVSQKSVTLSPEEQELRDRMFPDLGDFDFNVLWQMGETRTYSQATLIERGQLPDTVMLVLDGMIEVRREGQVMRGLRVGSLVGEMSLVSGTVANVDVVATSAVTVHEWQHRQITSLDQIHPPSAKAFRDLLTQNLAAKAKLL